MAPTARAYGNTESLLRASSRTSDWQERQVVVPGNAQIRLKNRLRALVHCHHTLLVIGLTTAFRLWQKQQACSPTAQTAVLPSLTSALLGGEGIARWRKRLAEENRDKIMVFIGQDYKIFSISPNLPF
jgi:hypothetical protein